MSRLALGRGAVGEQERAAAVVEQPLDALAALEAAERQAVGPEVVGLRRVHGHEQGGAGRAGGGGEGAGDEPAEDPGASHGSRLWSWRSSVTRRRTSAASHERG